MAPFRELQLPKSYFLWTAELQVAFEEAKEVIVEQVINGVKTFIPNGITLLSTDWSKIGFGAVLWQKKSECEGISLTCCNDGWALCGIKSSFCSQAESSYPA